MLSFNISYPDLTKFPYFTDTTETQGLGHQSFHISYPDLIKFPYFTDTTETQGLGHQSFHISYPDLIKFPYFTDTTKRGVKAPVFQHFIHLCPLYTRSQGQ
jgi:hypothetical protein